jgi:hypothetical protein
MIAPNEPFAGKGDSSNQFAVGVRSDGRIFIYKVPMKHLTKAEALNLAAWLCVLADPEGAEFERLVKAIKST